jgi:fumarate hydratase class II
MQPGSSIMPGKVNPVIPEVVNQVCFDVIGGDVTVTMAAEAGQLQLNVFEPVIAYRLLGGIQALTNACTVLRERCVVGITANPERLRWFVEQSIGIVTALVPVLGYETATEIAKTALETARASTTWCASGGCSRASSSTACSTPPGWSARRRERRGRLAARRVPGAHARAVRVAHRRAYARALVRREGCVPPPA